MTNHHTLPDHGLKVNGGELEDHAMSIERRFEGS